jgi:hypothetical protein
MIAFRLHVDKRAADETGREPHTFISRCNTNLFEKSRHQ